jgi:purine-binding chemotaxis protein CheW
LQSDPNKRSALDDGELIMHASTSSKEAIATREFLIFSLGGESYAIDILKVQEIRNYEAVTKIANAPSFIKGVVNLRGVIVPIIDMRIKFNLGEAIYNEFTIVIVLNIGKRVIGMVVDSVSDVISLTDGDIHPAPAFGTFDTQYLVGLVPVDDKMLILLDIERLMTSSEMALMDQVSA